MLQNCNVFIVIYMYKIYNKYVFVNIKIMGDIKVKKYVIGLDFYNSFCFFFVYKKICMQKDKKGNYFILLFYFEVLFNDNVYFGGQWNLLIGMKIYLMNISFFNVVFNDVLFFQF